MRPSFTTFVALLLAVATPTTAGAQQHQTALPTSAEKQITVDGKTLTLGMPKEQVFALLSRSYHLSEDSAWSAANKPYSSWHVLGETFVGGRALQLDGKPAQFLKGVVRFRGEQLDGVSWPWTPDSDDSSDFVANIINLAEHFSNAESTHCSLMTEATSTPHQEQKVATFRCGLRSLVIEHDRFKGSLPSGQKVPDSASIFEGLNW